MFLELKKYDLVYLNNGKQVIIDKEAGIEVDDKFYMDNGEVRTCKQKKFMDSVDDSIEGVDCIIDDRGKEILVDWVFKVIAMPEDFGYSVNFGPPHDRNYDWKYDEEGKRHVYLEEFHPDIIKDYKDDKINLVVEVICPHYGGKHINKDCSCKSGFVVRPKRFNGKIIMDGYQILDWPKETFYFH